MDILIILLIELIARIVLGLIGKHLGKDRKIGSNVGFTLGFILGLIGLIIIICFKKTEPLHETPPKENVQTNSNPSQSTLKAALNEPQYESHLEMVQEPSSDKSILTGTKLNGDTYLDQLAIEVCLHGENLEKYERMVTKQYGGEIYAHLQHFVDEVNRSRQRQLFTNTSIANLSYLGKMVSLSETTVNDIINQLK